MEIKSIFFIIFLGLQLSYVSSATDVEKLCILEKKMDVLEPMGMKDRLMMGDSDRIAALERRMEALELLCIARSGMERHCLVPMVLNGEAHCPEKLPPGSKCSVVCNPGYIATPGKETATCKKDGFWAQDMECEIPLVIVSGGLTDQSRDGDSSVEVLSLYPSKGCDRQIPDMPLAEGSHRTLHNLIYLPQDNRILACNGLTNKQKGTNSWDKPAYKASCDVWELKTNTWKHHSYPNQGSSAGESLCDYDEKSSSCQPDRKKGRYASEAVHVAGRAILLGGMVYDDSGHDSTMSGRFLKESNYGGRYAENYWQSNRRDEMMDRQRAFFCTAKVKEGGALMMGGLGQNKNGTVVEKSVQFLSKGWGIGSLSQLSKVTDMSIPRSGHGCTSIPGGELSVLVTGGTHGFGAAAMADAEMFSWNSNSWTSVTSMRIGRFGHAVVALGEKVFAIGGDDRNQNNMDTIEEYDIRRNTWNIIKQKLKKPRSNFGFTLVPHSIFDGCTIEKPLDE